MLVPEGPPRAEEEEEEEELYGAAEAEAGCARFNPPAALVPRLHVVLVRRMHHLCPLLPRNLLQPTPGGSK